ncbi:Uncharacterised protein [Streptococcus pneumoniae]|nr:Uncharacterised protein [Streptococcus pneumoniae]
MEASVPVFGNCCLDLPAEVDALALVDADSDAEADALVDAELKRLWMLTQTHSLTLKPTHSLMRAEALVDAEADARD